MSPSCDSVRTFLSAYLDGEAFPLAREDLERHLTSCEACAREAEGLRRLREEVQRAWVPAAVPVSLRRGVEALRGDRRARRSRRVVMVGSAVAALAVLLVGVLIPLSPAKASSLAEAAVHTHEGLVRGVLPLDFSEHEPTRLSTLLSQRLPFQVVLPRLEDPSLGLELEGARLVPLQGGACAAVVSYRRQGEPVSLAITPRPNAGQPLEAPRTEVFRNVPFESRKMGGYHVITWNEGALSYALVASSVANGRATCQVCHGPHSGLQDVGGFHRLQ